MLKPKKLVTRGQCLNLRLGHVRSVHLSHHYVFTLRYLVQCYNHLNGVKLFFSGSLRIFYFLFFK
jgi:hypothetical protein